MNQYLAIIVDDQQSSIDHLLDHMKNLEFVKVAGTFTDPKKALSYIRVNPIDLLILDVELGVMSGFEFLDSVPKVTFSTILHTAHPEFEDQGYHKKVVDVLLKPTSYIRFRSAIDRFDSDQRKLQIIKREPPSIFDHDAYVLVKGGGRSTRIRVRMAEVIYLEKFARNVYLYLNDGRDPIICSTAFYKIKDLFPVGYFIPFARGLIFNKCFFHSFEDGFVRLNHVNKKFRAGRMKMYPEFREFLMKNNI